MSNVINYIQFYVDLTYVHLTFNNVDSMLQFQIKMTLDWIFLVVVFPVFSFYLDTLLKELKMIAKPPKIKDFLKFCSL